MHGLFAKADRRCGEVIGTAIESARDHGARIAGAE
jgi:hypothetical protein